MGNRGEKTFLKWKNSFCRCCLTCSPSCCDTCSSSHKETSHPPPPSQDAMGKDDEDSSPMAAMCSRDKLCLGLSYRKKKDKLFFTCTVWIQCTDLHSSQLVRLALMESRISGQPRRKHGYPLSAENTRTKD